MSQTKRIDTYYNVTDAGADNPFSFIPNITEYGNTANDYHEYLLAFHADMPVFNDYNRLAALLLSTFAAHRVEFKAMYEAAPTGQTSAMNRPYTLNETRTHSGTDESETSGESHDKANTYDAATMRETHSTDTKTNGSFTHGHKEEVAREQWTAGDPIAAMGKIIDISYKNGVFMRIINTVIDAISCKVYTRETLTGAPCDEQ